MTTVEEFLRANEAYAGGAGRHGLSEPDLGSHV
jgi:hypothetical protein